MRTRRKSRRELSLWSYLQALIVHVISMMIEQGRSDFLLPFLHMLITGNRFERTVIVSSCRQTFSTDVSVRCISPEKESSYQTTYSRMHDMFNSHLERVSTDSNLTKTIDESFWSHCSPSYRSDGLKRRCCFCYFLNGKRENEMVNCDRKVFLPIETIICAKTRRTTKRTQQGDFSQMRRSTGILTEIIKKTDQCEFRASSSRELHSSTFRVTQPFGTLDS